MTDTKELGLVKLPNVRLSYPAIFKKKAQKNGELKYVASFVFPKDDEKLKKKIEKAYEEVCKEKFNGKVPAFKGYKYPIRDGDEPKDDGEDRGPEYEGMFFLNAKSDKAPVLMNGKKERIIEDDGTLYGGCYVNAIVRLYAVNNEDVKGVFVSLEGIMYAGKGEAFGAAAISEDEFGDFEDAEDDGDEF